MAALRTVLIALICVAAIAIAVNTRAQSGTGGASPQGLGNLRTPSSSNGSDRALEIVPRSGAPTPAAEETPESDEGAQEQENEPEPSAVPTGGPPSSMLGGNPYRSSPYLGISVQRIETHATPGHDVRGLEIVAVDPGSPAEQAGLRGRAGMTKLGATGATAGALMPPLDLVVMPLLNKSGQLGQTGDLIVALDDRRVTSEADLQTALQDSKPGDTIYFTVVRLERSGARTTLKIPVKLGPMQ
jgi:hypothetical protein